MVYLTARTATHLYKSPSSFDLSSSTKPTLYSTLPSVRFKPTNLRLHTSTWTLSSDTNSSSQRAIEDIYNESPKNDDPSMLLLSPYSKSCYLLAQANRSKSMNNLNASAAKLTLSRTQAYSKIDQRTKHQLILAKHRASILWLIAKANDDGRVPVELRDPFYRDQNGREMLKPWITQRMANAELYGRALANIYGVPDYSCLSHHNILQLLNKRGVSVEMIAGSDICEPITETLLLKNSPVQLSSHMVIIECIMTLYIREILIPSKVAEVVSRFSGDFDNYDESMLPDVTLPEEVALYWINRACSQLNMEIQREYMMANEQGMCPEDPCPVVPSLDELNDMCDGCSLYALLAFYCPNYVDWREICLKQDISIADSIYNLQRVQYISAEHFPSDICFLSLEDFLYLPEPIALNFLVFIADLLFLFEIQPVDCVTPPYLRLYPEYAADEFQPNYPQLPTPSEMKARSLKHQSWNDSLEAQETYYPSNHQMYDRRNSLHKTSSNTALNHCSTSRRNSLNNNNSNGSKNLHRRSSLISNGSEHQQPINSSVLTNHDDDYGINGQIDPNQLHHYEPEVENGLIENGQLSSYFSTLSISSAANNRTNVISSTVVPDSEYNKNRNRSSSGHLTSYFSNLSHNRTEDNSNRMSTHVRAKIMHPNNTDNVKSLLSHHEHPHYHNHIPLNADSQTTSSDTSSIAELSEYSDMPILRAKMSEKRKQIELERQQEHEKRVSSDQLFRQGVFKTYKSINNTDSGSDADGQDINSSKTYHSSNKEEEDNLTFEIHELNPIRREKSFTSSPKNTTFVRKNLFSASEDLKASMTGLNYANANDNELKSSSTKLQSTDYEVKKSSSDNALSTEKSKSESSSPLVEHNLPSKTAEEQTNIQFPPVAATSTTPQASTVNCPPIPQEQETVQQQQSAQTTTTRRSQWGQPMIPLGGHYTQSPPTWSQTPGSYVNPEWYGTQVSPYHMPPQPYPPNVPYGYSMGTMQPPPPGAMPPMRPYSLHIDPHQYSSYPMSQVYDSNLSLGYIQPGANNPPPSIFSPTSTQAQALSTPSSATSTYRVPKNVQSPQENFEIPLSENSVLQEENEETPTTMKRVEPNQQTPSEKHNETFFISFTEEKPLKAKQVKPVSKMPSSAEKQPLSRTATQTLVSSTEKSFKAEDDYSRYNKRQSIPPVPSVAFVIPTTDDGDISFRNKGLETETGLGFASTDNTNRDQMINEDEMTKKKEMIMKQSLKRRAEQEERRIQKEQELAAKRESERIKREQMDRKKEEERAKRALILEQYKQRKQIEEDLEKNGGCLPPVSRSSSTLVLNRAGQQQPGAGVTMRSQRLLSGGKPRPKSLHSTMIGFETNSSLSSGRLSSSRDEIDLSSRHQSSSRPQSALSSQMSSTVTTPTEYSNHSFAAELSMANTGPTSSNFYSTEYNGPKLFVKPSQKSNKALILNAINVVLAGAVNADVNRRVVEAINSCDSKYYLILFRNSGLQYRAIYSYNPEREEVIKLDGVGPRNVNNEMIDRFYKYNSGTKSFTPIQTKHLCVTIDAITIHNQLWMSKKQQPLTPRRFG